jgi:hypothetical protein
MPANCSVAKTVQRGGVSCLGPTSVCEAAKIEADRRSAPDSEKTDSEIHKTPSRTGDDPDVYVRVRTTKDKDDPRVKEEGNQAYKAKNGELEIRCL